MVNKSRQLTKRQAVLLDRLITFCERCGSPGLPLRVAKVIGYGSFFRGRDRPGDVDLYVVVEGDHPLFDRFRGLIEGGLVRRGSSSSPADRMRMVAAGDSDPEVAGAAELFAGWLHGFSDAMLYEHRSIVDQVCAHEPERFARRLLHAGLPGIRAQVDRVFDQTRTKVVYEIWSPELPDVRSTVERIWTSDRRSDLIAELRSFVDQARPHFLQIAILNRIADRLARSRTRIVDEKVPRSCERYDDWIRSHDFGFNPKLCVRATDGLLSSSECDGQPDPPGLETLDYDALGDEELRILVEERRQALKRLRNTAYVLRISTNVLAQWCFSDKQNSKLQRWDYVTTKVMECIPARNVNPKSVREILEGELKRLSGG